MPSFWSEQYDLYIQGVGWPPPKPRSTSTGRCRPMPLRPGAAAAVLVYAMGINVQRDLAVARRLIERQIPVDPAALADPNKPLEAMLKANG